MKLRHSHCRAVWTLSLLILGVCLLASAHDRSGNDCQPQFGPWTAPVNLGPPVNTVFTEVDPFISKDGRSLYFSCPDCPGGFGGYDLWVSRRASVNDPWGPPENLGPSVNTASNETNPALSNDEHKLYFTSNRPGGLGATDLYVSRRHNRRDDFGWQLPENLGAGINSAFNDRMATYFEDDETGDITLYFSSDRPGGPGSDDIYSSTLQTDETFGPAALVVELSSPASDKVPSIRRRDGLEIFLSSNREGSVLTPGGKPSPDLWVSTRPSTADPWSEPVNLGTVVNSPFDDARTSLSSDGTILYFASAQRAGNVSTLFDIWMTTRERLDGEDCGHDHRGDHQGCHSRHGRD